MFFTKNKHFVQEQMTQYLETLTKCKESFTVGMRHFISCKSVDDVFLEYLSQVKKYEGIADDIRDNVELRMYEESLIPESRGDILAFLENLDKIPTTILRILQFIEEVHLKFPDLNEEKTEWFQRHFREIVAISMDTFEFSLESAGYFFTNPRKVREYTVAVNRKESAADAVESQIIKEIFKTDGFTDLQRMLFMDLTIKISSIDDLCKAFQRRIILLALKKMY